MSRPRALDLFCCAGGAARGLQHAGFHVTGVDIEMQPRYAGDCFVQADALMPPFDLRAFDFIWASPPCQHASLGSQRWIAEGRTYPALIEPTRDMLRASGVSFVIENVPGAAVRSDLVLTGPMFGLKTQRRRHFELSFFCLAPGRRAGIDGPRITPGFCTVAGHGGHGPNRIAAWKEALDIDWMTKAELTQAIPPVYAEFIGRAALQHLRMDAAA